MFSILMGNADPAAIQLASPIDDKESNMNCKRLRLISLAAVALLSLSDAALADGRCSAATLRGAYGFSAEGRILGLLDQDGVHPFKTPSILNDVAILSFDGSGQFSRTDFGNINGVPKTSDFNPNQHGTYTVNSNCTGTMTITYDSGVVLALEMIITDDGRIVKALIATETVPSSTTPIDGTSCGSSCQQAVQVNMEGRKVDNFSFR